MTIDFRQGDCRDVLRTLPDQSVHCCVTSPPYFGLRDYGMADQIGLEPTPDEFVSELVSVFREVRRVLRDDGTLWLNLGDSYGGAAGNTYKTSDDKRAEMGEKLFGDAMGRNKGGRSKDLLGMPWRVAFALQADGWYLRQDIIWHKANPMPESVTDRCTKGHEYIFMMSKFPTYYFDVEAIKEPATGRAPGNKKRHKYAGEKFAETKSNLATIEACEMRRPRSVWTVASAPFKGAHFATFPPDLIRPCILAGCPLGGTVLDPFGGAGTTGLVAAQSARNAILIELNPEYNEISRRRNGHHKMPWEHVETFPWS